MAVVSLAAAACVVAVMERWLRAAGLRHSPWLAGVLLCTTWLFARTAVTDAPAMLTTLFSTLSLSTFYFVYTDSRGRAWLPVWLFGSLLCGGAVGLAAPLAGIAAFLIIKREWRQTGRWFGLREILIFSALCLSWLMLRWDGGTIFRFAPDDHLFWYVPRLLRDMLPWTPVYLLFIGLGVWRKKLRSDVARLLYTTLWANIVVMSLIGPKSELYLLPAYPMAAYLTAAILARKS
jgi:4-amino-4-deoxy-L-arabinose transferase-like glycosyltransferase